MVNFVHHNNFESECYLCKLSVIKCKNYHLVYHHLSCLYYGFLTDDTFKYHEGKA